MDKTRLAEMLRVDHAGEAGAKAIYQGQRAVLGGQPETDRVLAEQQAQEEVHLAFFNEALAKHGIRPSALLPVWQAGGFALGALTALLAPKAAHACTMAVEEVIADHYQQQVDELGDDKAMQPLRKTIAQFRAEEIAHGEEAEQADGRGAPAFPLLHDGIKTLVKTAILVAEKL